MNLDDLVRPGLVVCLHGRARTGKSAALLACLRSADPGDRAHVPQRTQLLDELTVYENVGARWLLRAQAVPDAVEAALAALDLRPLADRWVDELSVGERQRVGVAQAVASSPSLLAADEPAAHQDDARRALVLAALRAVAAAGGAVVVASHDDAVAAAADLVVPAAAGRRSEGWL